MPFPQLRLYFDNTPADDGRLALVGEIRVDQAIGMAAEAELSLPVSTGDNGEWSLLTDDFAQPFTRVRIEVNVGDAGFVPLIDGPIVGQRFALSADPSESRMVLVVQDDSALLNREEQVRLFENMADHEIARQLISGAQLTPEVDTVPGAGAALERVVVQRGSAMQLLQELARRHGMFAYVKPGQAPGRSIGVFARPNLSAGSLPELLLMGPDRTIDRFDAEFDALRPVQATAGSVTIADKSGQSAQTTTASLPAMDGDPVNSVLGQVTSTRLSRTREEQADLEAAAQAAVDLASFAYSATTELDSLRYGAVVTPCQVVRVAGVGVHLGGDYLVSRVTHLIGDASYRQQLTLRRNARGRSAGGAGGGGIF